MTAELWVARDGPPGMATGARGRRAPVFVLSLWISDPTGYRQRDGGYRGPGYAMGLPSSWFPEIAPGECRRVTLTLSPAPAPDTRTREGE